MKSDEAVAKERKVRGMPGTEDEEARRRRMRAVAVSKVKCDCTRTAAQILRGQSMLPPCHATAEAQRKLLARMTVEKTNAV